MKRKHALLIAFTIVLAGCKSSRHADLGDGLFADIHTSKGDIVVKLEDKKTPVTVANFISLAEGKSPFVSDSLKGKKYFDGLTFHRVIKDFMIQGGDPTGTGSGNPGYKFKNEIVDSLNFSQPGVLAMANAGPNTNGSQFFITHKPTPFLKGGYTIFGHVVEGMDVVDSIANVKTSQDPPTKDRPIVDVVMKKVEIIRNGKEAKKYDAVKIMTDYFAEEKEKTKEKEKQKAEFVAELEKQKAEAETLPSGLKIYTLKEGEGEKPKVGQKVLVYYAGYLENGDLFDSNMEAVAQKNGTFNPARKQGGGYESIPMDYSPDAQLIAGFREGLMTMKVGDKVRLFIPSHLGYGTSGAGNVIPPDSDLIFDLEITGIAK